VRENVLGCAAECLLLPGGVDRTCHSFYSRFINYRSDIVKVDAAVEAALGVTLLAGGFGATDFPHPVGRVVAIVVGALLVFLGVVLWRAPVGLRELAAGNAITAVAAVAWLAAASGFSLAGSTLVAAAAGALFVLAAVQVATLRA
jgi:hypothetical protein